MNITKCPFCSHENVEGLDRCENCFHSLMQVDLPTPTSNDSLQTVMMTVPVVNLIDGTDLLVADVDDKVKKIVEIFQEQDKNCVLVYKDHYLVGIISYRDLLKKVALSERNISDLKASDVMTRNPETVKAQDPIAYVINKMAIGGFRHVPVLSQDGSPLSILAVQDVLSYLATRDHS